MFSRRMPLVAVAAVTAAAAVAIPVTSASAAPTVDPTVCQLLNIAQSPFGPTSFFVGGASLGSVLASTGASVGCPAAPTLPSLVPTLRWSR
jgi:hypothetical protein